MRILLVTVSASFFYGGYDLIIRVNATTPFKGL